MSHDLIAALIALTDPASAFQIAQAVAAASMAIAGVLVIEVRAAVVSARFVLL